MSRAIKLKNNDYIDSSGIVHNKESLKDIFDQQIQIKSSNGIAQTTSTVEQTMLSFTIEQAGTYLFLSSIPLNYYGQTGRELYLRLKINNAEKWSCVGVCNTYIWTLSMGLASICFVPSNSTIKVTIQDPLGKSYACGSFLLNYIRVK